MTYPFFNELGFITITQKIISLLVIGVHLGSSILLYVESFGDRLLLMRMHEDLSSDMKLLVYVFYGFVVIFYLAECHGTYEIDYITSIFGGSCISKKEGKCQRILSNCNLYVTQLMQMTTNKRWQNGKHVLFSKHYKPCKLSSME